MELKASIEQCVGSKPLESTPEPAEPLPPAAAPDRTPTPTSAEVRWGRAGSFGVGVAESALGSDHACVPLHTNFFQLPALLEAWEPLLSFRDLLSALGALAQSFCHM